MVSYPPNAEASCREGEGKTELFHTMLKKMIVFLYLSFSLSVSLLVPLEMKG